MIYLILIYDYLRGDNPKDVPPEEAAYSFFTANNKIIFEYHATPGDPKNRGYLSDNLMTNIEKCWVYIYFALTTMSTVGFGDIVPRSDFERVLGAFLLLSGVAIFSFVMSIFVDLL